jgi:hypothetical protein
MLAYGHPSPRLNFLTSRYVEVIVLGICPKLFKIKRSQHEALELIFIFVPCIILELLVIAHN